jgi:hypothetical protein
MKAQRVSRVELKVKLNRFNPCVELLFKVFVERSHDESDRSCENNHYNELESQPER